MELVPIVITTLKIVTILAVIVLSISYISFKIRQKSTPQKDFASMQNAQIEKTFVQHVKKRITRITKEIHPPNPTKEKLYPKDVSIKKEIKQISKEKSPRVEILKNQKPEVKNNESPKPTELNTLQGDILEKYVDDDDKLYTLKANKKNKK